MFSACLAQLSRRRKPIVSIQSGNEDYKWRTQLARLLRFYFSNSGGVYFLFSLTFVYVFIIWIPPSLSVPQHNNRQSTIININFKMKLIALGALFLPFVLVYGDLFDGVDPLCAPCLNEVVADGPSNTRSKEFVNYVCVGQGASAVAQCITECGISTSGDIIDTAAAQVPIIMGIMFDYWYVYALIKVQE
jgi:hypothetical protein